MGKITHQERSISQDLVTLLEGIGTTKQVSKDAYVFCEGMPAQYIYLVKSGLIQIGKMSLDGKELTLRICQEESIIGELTLFADNAFYLLNAKALETSTIYAINKSELEKTLQHDSTLAFEYMKWSSNQMRIFQYKIRDLLLHGKKGAFYSTLIRLANSYGINYQEGIKLDISLTDTELAAFAAATRESANRMLKDLRKHGVVSTLESGEIFIKDLQFLRDYIGCEDCPLEICHID